jgi:hypothetical protein
MPVRRARVLGGAAALLAGVAAAHETTTGDRKAAGSAAPPAIATPYRLSRDNDPEATVDGARLLGTLKLAAVTWRGHLLGGLSALAYDSDDGVLYAVSDRGALFHLTLEFDDRGLLTGARLRDAVALKDAAGRPLRGEAADAEGMALRRGDNGIAGDGELAVSFERSPRILRFTPRGSPLGNVALPARLRDRGRYRSSNRGLESLAWHPAHGYLAANEQPFVDSAEGEVEIHAVAPRDGSARWWRYPLAAEPNAALTDLAALPDGSLLALERGYGFLYVPLVSTVRRVAVLPDAPGALVEVDTLLRLSSGQGWALDNFEGLAVLPGGRILIVSDDNTRAVQATLLAAFELAPTQRHP